jgi:hypothetical protein
VEVVERFLLDRVDTEAGRAPPGSQLHAAAAIHAHKTGPALTFVKLAVAWAKIALNSLPILDGVPPAPRVQSFRSVHQSSFHFLTL